MSKFYYCHVCGTILDREDVKQIITKSWTTKKKEKLFDVCPKCAKKITDMQFKPVNFRSRKKISYSSVAISDFATRKSSKLYDVLEQQLQEIRDLEVDIHDLKLTRKSGTRIYTEHQVTKWLLAKRANMLEGMYLLYQYQTDDERTDRETKYANSVGFNKPDADFLSGMSRIYEEKIIKGGHAPSVYTKKQFEAIKARMLKYTKQLTLYINAEGRKLIGV